MATGSRNIVTRKIALMGYPCVGKSSITLRFVQGHFPDAYDTTIEDLHNKPYRWLGRDYNLKITDTAGQQEYSIFPRSCSVDIDGFILVYAIDDKKSFEIIQVIHDKIMETVGDNKVPIVIVGNKSDLQHASRMVTKEDGSKLAQKWRAAFIETSAKDNTMMSENIFQPTVRCDSGATAPPGEEDQSNMDGAATMSRFPNLPKMAEAVGNVDVVAKVESLKKWTIGTFKNSKQQLLEHMGKVDKTVDEQFEKECEELKDLHRRCSQLRFLKFVFMFHLKARIEFDVSRHELESLHSHATASPTAIQMASDKASQHRDKYEGLKADVRVKLRLLEEHRVKVMTSRLEQLQGALAAYFSGNAELLAAALRELASLSTPATSFLL
ncbi:AH domain-containing protein [Trichostrongylus colubriformis]|uniref:AH domain-containing protein n=1 Tax=Trichostrongylus colubriformis TaxID=6319 RepID=A0AAN8F9K5_TRICO